MKKILTGTLAALLCMALALSAALAETLSLEGTVTAGDTIPVYAPIGGTVGEVKVAEGQQVAAGDVLYVMKTEKVYAEEDGTVRPHAGWTNIYIYPGYRFKVLDALVTNFHLPESTLIMLVSALAGRERILAAYEEAVRERYRFFSFGDAMLIQ